MFDRINLSYFATTLGYWIALFFIPLLVLELTQSALLVSVAYALDILPYIVLTPIAGALADKFNKKHLIIIGEMCCFLASLALFFLTFEKSNVYFIILLGFLISSFSAIHHPVFQSILPELYHHDILPKVNGNIASINSFTGIIAPAILGVLFGFLSNKQIALIIPLLYLVSAAAFYGIVYRAHTTKHKINIIKDNKEAVNYLKTQTTLMDFSYLFFFVNFGLRMILSSLIWLYTTHFYLAKNLTAYHFIFIGIMSILGAKIAGKYIVGKYTTDKIIFRSSIVIAGLIFSLALFDNVFYLTFIWGLVSLFSMFIIVAYFTYRQQQTERALLSRVVALTRLISYLAIPPAVLLSGYLLDAFGAPNLIYFIAGACVLLPSLYFANKSSAART